MPAPKDYPWGEIRIAIVSGFMTQKEASEKYGVPLGTIAAECARKDWLGNKAKKLAAAEGANAAPAAPAKPVYERYQHDDAKSERIVKETAQSMKDEIRDTGARIVRKGLKALDHEDISGLQVVAGSKNLKDLIDVGAKVCGFDTPENATILSLNFLSDEVEPVLVHEAHPVLEE